MPVSTTIHMIDTCLSIGRAFSAETAQKAHEVSGRDWSDHGVFVCLAKHKSLTHPIGRVRVGLIKYIYIPLFPHSYLDIIYHNQ